MQGFKSYNYRVSNFKIWVKFCVNYIVVLGGQHAFISVNFMHSSMQLIIGATNSLYTDFMHVIN